MLTCPLCKSILIVDSNSICICSNFDCGNYFDLINLKNI